MWCCGLWLHDRQFFCQTIIIPVWPDLAKSRHFWKNFKVFGHFKKFCIGFGKLLNLLWQMFYAIGQIFIAVNCQRMKHNLVKVIIIPSTGRQGGMVALLECQSEWPDWVIYCTLVNFSRPVATIILPILPTFLGNICKVVKIFHLSSKIIFGQML